MLYIHRRTFTHAGREGNAYAHTLAIPMPSALAKRIGKAIDSIHHVRYHAEW